MYQFDYNNRKDENKEKETWKGPPLKKARQPESYALQWRLKPANNYF